MLSTVQPEEDFKTLLHPPPHSYLLLKTLAPFLIQSKTQNSGNTLQDLSAPSPCYLMGANSPFLKRVTTVAAPFFPRSSAISLSS